MTISDTEDRTDDLEDFVREWMTEDNIPGVSVAVVQGDETVYAEGFGSRDLDENLPSTPETLYGIGSCTKSFTALAVMQLQEDGMLDVNDPVSDYLDFDLGDDITIHNLLTHTSGVPSLGVSETLIGRRAGLGEVGVPMGTKDDFYSHVNNAGDEIAGEPGERFFYFNSGYTLLGEIVEDRSGMSFDEYVEEEILSPIEMERSTFSKDEFENDPDRMTPYHMDDGKPSPANLPVRDLSYAPGGLLSSVEELADYLIANMNSGEFKGRRIASEETFETLHEGYIETDPGPYGYGWRRRNVLGETLIGHGGSIGVSTAYIGFTEDSDLGIAVLCNTAPGYGLVEVGKGILAVLLGEDPEELPFFARRERASELTGEYETYRGVRKGEVTQEGEFLKLEFNEPFPSESILVPTDESMKDNEFYTVLPSGRRREVKFDVQDGNVDLYIERWRLHKV